ncbi:hypothetical protein D3C86_1650110 [compost metagenome]
MLGIDRLDAAIIQLHDFNGNAGSSVLHVVGDDHFFEDDLEILDLVAACTAKNQSDLFQVFTSATGFHQFATGLVEYFGKSEGAQRRAPGSCATSRTGGGASTLLSAEVVAVDFDPVTILLVQGFARNTFDFDVSVKCHTTAPWQ